MNEQTLNEEVEKVAEGWTRKLNIRLAGAAVGLALALLIAPGSRRLFLAQAALCLPTPGNVASLAGSQLGVKPDCFEGPVAVQAAVATAERHPNDLQVQIANAALVLPSDGGHVSLAKVKRLRALEGRFGNSPSLYANILRFEAQGEVRARHLLEQYTAGGELVTPDVLELARQSEAKGISQSAYAAYDQDAESGERLDPDNAYFPFMRAVGLFGANRDEEALAAMERASRKPHWREYYNDELKGQWKLQDGSSVNNSALFHSVSAMAILFPQYAQMRAAVRIVIHKAIKAEEAGNFSEGLKLRECTLRLGSLMRSESANIIAALVGNAIVDTSIARPGGEAAIKSEERNKYDEPVSKAATETRRLHFDAHLQRIHAASEIAMFHAAQQTGDQIKAIIKEDSVPRPFDRPFTNLLRWWMLDLVTLSNLLWVLILGGIAVVCLRSSRLKSGEGLPKYARYALPLGWMAGGWSAPYLLTRLSQMFEGVAYEDRLRLMLVGCSPLLLVLCLPAESGLIRLRRLGVFAGGFACGALMVGGCFWQMRGIWGIALLQEVYTSLASDGLAAGPEWISKLFWFTTCVPWLLLGGCAVVSRMCRVPLSVGLARGIRGLMVPVSAVLLLLYGGMLLCTIRAEATVEYGLKRTLENEGQYLADLSNKQWPRSDIAKYLVNHE